MDNKMKWLCLAVAVVVYCCLILGMIPPKPSPEPEVPPETTAATEASEPTEPTEATIPEEEPLPWNLLLVNPWNGIPQDFTVELMELEEGHAVDQRAGPALQEMMSAMKAQGLKPYICSSYRTEQKQQTLFRNKVDSYLKQGYSLVEADEAAGKWVAVPGTSEHQTGLAVDIIDVNYPYLNEKQEDTATQKWLMANSWEYGFILRYPSDKSDITGIYYEPWHYRYVGKEAAKEIFEQDICLEEYLESIER